MEEIQINEFIRTDDGHIFQVIDIEKNAVKIQEKYYREWISLCCIIKHSKNIIDLIEVGDIVELDGEKYQVIFDESYNKLGILIPNKDYLAIRHISLEYIFQQNKKVTILTHEQYENNCYRIGE